jgi:hypothetical protein
MGRSMPGVLLTGDYRSRERSSALRDYRVPEPVLDGTVSRLCSKIKSKIGSDA